MELNVALNVSGDNASGRIISLSALDGDLAFDDWVERIRTRLA
jgi:hypothetical protein